MKRYPRSREKNTRRFARSRKSSSSSPTSELKATAGRIIDMLQQLVLKNPHHIVALEIIVKGLLNGD